MKVSAKGGGSFETCPEYSGRAVCVDVTPLQKVQTKYGEKEKFRLVFEIDAERSDGSPFCVWSAPFTPSISERAALRKFLRQWEGRDLTAEELEGLEMEDYLHRPAHIVVVHDYQGENVYANIVTIRPHKKEDGAPLKPSGKFVRKQDRDAGKANYSRAAQPDKEPGADAGEKDPMAIKVHVGKFKGVDLIDLDADALQNLIDNWIPRAQAQDRLSADDKRLMRALEIYQEQQQPAGGSGEEDDDIPF